MLEQGDALFLEGWREGWAAPPLVTVSEWAEENIVLDGKAASEPGPYRVARTPYAREPMDCMSVTQPVERIVLLWAAQTSKSTVLNNCVGYWAAVDPGPMMLVEPTLDLAKRYSRQRITPMIERSPALREIFAVNRSRDDANTMLTKDFAGGCLVMAGANSAAALRMMPVRYLGKDEIDAYPQDVDGEGDPCDLADARQTTFSGRAKGIETSTPGDDVASRIGPKFEAGSRARYFVACPHCGELQALKWANLRWDKDQPEGAHYVCEHHGCVIEEREKATMLLEEGHGGRARWIHEEPTAPVKSYHLSGLYSPLGWLSWAQMAREFLEAKRALDYGDVAKMKTFVNVRLAETWKDQGEQANASELELRAQREAYRLGEVPAGVLMLTQGVDVQGNRLELVVKGWGRHDESWLVDYAILWGDPVDLLSGKDPRLDEAEKRIFRNAHGRELRIAATAIDSGGHHTHDVYMHARTRRALRHVFAIKGQSQPGKPILGRPSDVEVNYRGAKVRGGQVWPVGSDTAKELIYGRLRVAEAGPGYMHFSPDLGAEYFAGLTAEKLVTRYHKGRPRREWILPKGKRNEPLDCEVYALAAAHYAGLTRMRDADFDRLEASLGPDLFASSAQSEAQAATTPPAGEAEATPAPTEQPTAETKPRAPAPFRRRGGFVQRWRT